MSARWIIANLAILAGILAACWGAGVVSGTLDGGVGDGGFSFFAGLVLGFAIALFTDRLTSPRRAP